MKILPKFLVLIALMLPVGAENLPVLTLDDALSAAAENNITLKQAAITANQRIRNANNYIKDYLPTFGLSLSADTGVSFPSTSVEKTTFNGLGMDLSASASFSYTLSGSEITDGTSRRLEKESASLDYENSYSSLEDGITSAYWTLATYDIAIENAKTSLEDMQDSYNSTLDMYNAGVADELTLSNIELALNNAEIALAEAENNKALALASFKALTGIEEDFQTEPMPETVLLSLPTAEELFAEYAEGTWEIRNARNTLMSAENSKKEATLNQYMPTVTANVGYTYQGGISSKANALTGLAAGQYGTNANNLTGSITVNIPLSSYIPGSSVDVLKQTAENNVKLNSLTLQNTQDSLLSTIREDVITIEQQQARFGMLEKSLEIAKRTYELREESYNAGLSSASELADSRTALLEAQNALLSSRLTHLLSSYNLASTLGINLQELQETYSTTEKETI